jgi:hypothetical protein
MAAEDMRDDVVGFHAQQAVEKALKRSIDRMMDDGRSFTRVRMSLPANAVVAHVAFRIQSTMWAATAWDDADWEVAHARGWTVMGRLRGRQMTLRRESEQRRRRPREEGTTAHLMLPISNIQAWQSSMRPVWTGGTFVVAMLFAHPDSQAIQTLDARGGYFNVRTGDTWDLFFPGYHISSESPAFEREAGSRPVRREFTEQWFFNDRDFDMFRQHVQDASKGRWVYSGGTDLVLVTGYMPTAGEITIDWASTLVGSLTEPDGTKTLTIAQVIERLTTDLEKGAEDASYGVGDVVDGHIEKSATSSAREVAVAALGGIAAELAKAGLGL